MIVIGVAVPRVVRLGPPLTIVMEAVTIAGSCDLFQKVWDH